MSIITCEGPNGAKGYQYRDDTRGDLGPCHTIDPDLPQTEGRAKAMRAAMRDSNNATSGGDPRMARDG
jgi:hypothetical protein